MNSKLNEPNLNYNSTDSEKKTIMIDMKENLVMPINIKNTHPESYLNDTVS